MLTPTSTLYTLFVQLFKLFHILKKEKPWPTAPSSTPFRRQASSRKAGRPSTRDSLRTKNWSRKPKGCTKKGNKENTEIRISIGNSLDLEIFHDFSWKFLESKRLVPMSWTRRFFCSNWGSSSAFSTWLFITNGWGLRGKGRYFGSTRKLQTKSQQVLV